MDGIPAEFFKCICTKGNPACVWAVRVCNYVWQHGIVPDAWHSELVAAILKNGDPGLRENYLREEGAEQRIWPTQFDTMWFSNWQGLLRCLVRCEKVIGGRVVD